MIFLSFPSGGSGFSSKPTTPTGTTPSFPPMGSPSRPPPSPQHTGGWQPHTGGGFPSWQPGAATSGGWQQQGQGPAPQPKPSPSHTSMPHTSPQNRPNYNVSFSAMGGGSPSAGSKAQAGMGKLSCRSQSWLQVQEFVVVELKVGLQHDIWLKLKLFNLR